MSRILLVVAVVFCIGLACSVKAQDAGQRTQVLIAALDKTKYKKKEKRDFAIEMYIDIKNAAALKSSSAEYAGLYESQDSGYRLDLRVSAGTVTGSGYDTANFDSAQKVSFTLRDARIDGALLTATKVYENGETRRFEAAFVNRTVTTGKNPNEITDRQTSYGLGFIESSTPVIAGGSDRMAPSAGGSWTNRVFLERR